MLVSIGTTNPSKISAVAQSLPKIFPDLPPDSFTVRGVNVESGVRDQVCLDVAYIVYYSWVGRMGIGLGDSLTVLIFIITWQTVMHQTQVVPTKWIT
jgi:non-canonical (house-cleaning) NTP pyrophosphatase